MNSPHSLLISPHSLLNSPHNLLNSPHSLLNSPQNLLNSPLKRATSIRLVQHLKYSQGMEYTRCTVYTLVKKFINNLHFGFQTQTGYRWKAKGMFFSA